MGSHESCYYSDDIFKKHNLHVSDASWSIKYMYICLFGSYKNFKKCSMNSGLQACIIGWQAFLPTEPSF